MQENKEQVKVTIKKISYVIAQNKQKARGAIIEGLTVTKCIKKFSELLNDKVLSNKDFGDDDMFVFRENLEESTLDKISKAPNLIKESLVKMFNIIGDESLLETYPYYFVPEVVEVFKDAYEGDVQGIRISAIKTVENFLGILDKINKLVITYIKKVGEVSDEEFAELMGTVNEEQEQSIGGELNSEDMGMAWETKPEPIEEKEIPKEEKEPEPEEAEKEKE